MLPPAESHVVFLTLRDFREPRNILHSTLYKLVREGKLKLIKRGRRSLVHCDEAHRFDRSLIEAAA